MIETNLAKLVDYDGGIGEVRFTEQMAKNGCLATTQEAGKDMDRDPVIRN